MTEVRLATLNLYQYAEPGTYWYERESDNTHSAEAWEAKRNWVRSTLAALDADVVALQEVFSTGSLRDLANEVGYEHVAIVAEPPRDEADPAVFLGPVVAIVSRHPFAGEPSALPVAPELADGTPLAADFAFRRDIVRASIDLPGLGSTTVMSAHLKSQGAFVDGDAIAELPNWRERFREHLRQRAIKDADQIVRRSGEAAAIYLAAMEEVEADRNAPIVVLGDLNDTPDSPTLRLATQREWVRNIARRRYTGIESPADRSWFYAWRLYDAFGLAPNQSGIREPTHASSWRYPASMLDYALVSNGLNPRNPARVGTVVEHRVFGEHFDDERPLETSDHAAVRITIETGRVGSLDHMVVPTDDEDLDAMGL